MKYVKLIITSILFTALFWPLFPSLIQDWIIVPDNSHGFLIPFISLYFLWYKRNDLKKTKVSPAAIGILFIAAGLMLYMAAIIGYQFFAQCISMLVVLFGIVYTQAGKAIAKKASFAIGYLMFMVPLPDLAYATITFHLRLFSTKMAFSILHILGISATREGNIINLPTCTLIVANPCSGLRGLVVFMAASLAIGYVAQKSIANRAILFLSAITLAILLNTARLVFTGLFVDILEMGEIPQTIHDATGYVVLIAGFLVLFAISDYLRKVR